MLKSNSKIFKTKVQEYIIKRLDTDYTNDLKEQLENTVSGFYDWYQGYEVKRIPNKYKAFGDWLSGLPSQLNIEFSYYDCRNTLKEWFEQNEKESQKYDDNRVWENYLYFITREFESLCKKNNIEF